MEVIRGNAMHYAQIRADNILSQAIKYWKYVAPVLTYPKNEHTYHWLVARLDELLDIVGEDEKHPFMGLVDAVSNLISVYEAAKIKKPKFRGIAALQFLMDTQQLTQADLPEIASQGVLSEILNGKRILNLRQIKLLAKRFKVEPATFIDD